MEPPEKRNAAMARRFNIAVLAGICPCFKGQRGRGQPSPDVDWIAQIRPPLPCASLFSNCKKLQRTEYGRCKRISQFSNGEKRKMPVLS
ncbi:hypothetical protein [Cupriavidus sp. AU9028]|uniref:hypothetical protein n=1 Tax=Cupriavidus sp. AU9028 TaxID=2871157 RepID=UPI001C95FA48|nr:hypothetical protein [Cupriavidus sp. AU9028]MBY4895436.1 hypothetical protein [Cupriavidus sp. AU9028]